MSDKPSVDVTRLLHDWQAGDRQALDRLIALVYEELHVLASRSLAHEWRTGAIQTTALVNEAYMKLVDQRRVDWQNRAHFFAIAAQVMRRVLLDDARQRLREKRGGGVPTISLEQLTPSGARIADRRRRPDCDRSRPLRPGPPRSGSSADRRAAVLRRPDGGGNQRGAWHLAGDRQARVGDRQRLAASRADDRRRHRRMKRQE